MHNKLKSAIKIIAICVIPGISYGSISDLKLSPYAGIEAGMVSAKFKSGYGGDVFKKNSAGFGGFAGIELFENLGIEVGYFGTSLSKKTSVVEDGAFEFGIEDATPLTDEEYEAKFKLKGMHISLVPKYKFEDFNTSIMGLIGVSRAKANVSLDLKKVDGVAATQFERDQNAFSGSKSKTIFRLGGGAEYQFNENLALRASAVWENTSKIEIEGTTLGSSDPYKLKMKDSIKYSLGVLWKF